MRRHLHVLLAVALLPLLALLPVGCSDDESTGPEVGPCSIDIYTPDSNRTYFSGDDVNLRWHASGGGSVVIDLLRGDAVVDTLSAREDNDGYFWWEASTLGNTSGADYTLRVTSTGDAGCTDAVPIGLVNTIGCLYVPTVPDTTLQAGQDYLITWDSERTSGSLSIELWFASVDTVYVATLNGGNAVEDTGSFLWQNVDSYNLGTASGYLLRMTDSRTPNCRAFSGTFSIIDTEICYIDILSPIQGSSYENGDQMTISYEAHGGGDTYYVRLYNGQTQVGIIDDVTAPADDYLWTVTDFGYTDGPQTAYRIRISDADDVYCYGYSAYFSIPRAK
jgi:hypothetical protein